MAVEKPIEQEWDGRTSCSFRVTERGDGVRVLVVQDAGCGCCSGVDERSVDDELEDARATVAWLEKAKAWMEEER